MSKQRPTYDGGKPKMPGGGKPQWTPSEAEAAVLDGLDETELLDLIAKGGDQKEKVRRWWMARNPGTDVSAYLRQVSAWQAASNVKKYGA